MLHRAYCSCPQTPPLRILWSKPTITHCARILASFKDFPYFPHFCKNRSWHPSGKPQCFAAFILASFKTAQYPCGFAHTRRTQKHPFFTTQPHRTWHPSTKPQCFARFNLAAFKTTQYPCTFAHRQIFKKHCFFSRPHHNLTAFKKYSLVLGAPGGKNIAQPPIRTSAISAALRATPRRSRPIHRLQTQHAPGPAPAAHLFDK